MEIRAANYSRVSDPSQVEGHSLDAQVRLFYELCKSRGWKPVGIYREEGRSAHSEAITKRPAFKQLLDDAGKRLFNVVVVHSIDRWSRNLRVTLESIATLARHNVALVSITENIDYSTPQGKLFTQMLGPLGGAGVTLHLQTLPPHPLCHSLSVMDNRAHQTV